MNDESTTIELRFYHPDGRVTTSPVDIGHEYQPIRLGCSIILGEDDVEPAIVTNVRSATEFDVDEHPLSSEIVAAFHDPDLSLEESIEEFSRIISRPMAEA